MLIIAGLGNPGAKYAHNRHNIGFMAVNEIADSHGFQPFKSRFQSMVAEGRLDKQKVLLLKPQTFMNKSGQALGEAMRFYKLTPADVIVIHDEIDLAPGKCRVKQGGGHAGHNGLRSIHQHIGPDYARIRLGVGHPGNKDAVPRYVLHDFSKADQDWLGPLIDGIGDGAAHLAHGDTGKFMNAVSLRTNPPRSGTGDKAKGQKPKPANQSPPTKPPATQPPTTQSPKLQKAEPPKAEPKSKMQQLMDRFSKPGS